MYDLLIARQPLSELRKAAEGGRAYYSCEEFEDRYGRLIVGIGARLEGRALWYVAKSGRKAIYVSPVVLYDGVRFRSMLRGAVQREFDRRERTGCEVTPFYSEVWDRSSVSVRKAVGEAMQAVHRVCPEAVDVIERLRPHPRDLLHGVEVAEYARRLMQEFNSARKRGLVRVKYPYSGRVQEEVYLAGVVHDIGRWRGQEAEGHAVFGAQVLKNLAGSSSLLRGLAGIVAQHHNPLSGIGGGWEVHRTAPVVFAEAVLECEDSPGAAVRRLVSQAQAGEAGAILSCLCNLEGAAPPRAVVRVEHRGMFELAVSLKAPEDDPFGPYLLRFARWKNGGHLTPLCRSDEGEREALVRLTALGHPKWEGGVREVVSLLPETVYDRSFRWYERLLPVFRKMMERRLREREGDAAESIADDAGGRGDRA